MVGGIVSCEISASRGRWRRCPSRRFLHLQGNLHAAALKIELVKLKHQMVLGHVDQNERRVDSNATENHTYWHQDYRRDYQEKLTQDNFLAHPSKHIAQELPRAGEHKFLAQS